jgi:hypothetical protein
MGLRSRVGVLELSGFASLQFAKAERNMTQIAAWCRASQIIVESTLSFSSPAFLRCAASLSLPASRLPQTLYCSSVLVEFQGDGLKRLNLGPSIILASDWHSRTKLNAAMAAASWSSIHTEAEVIAAHARRRRVVVSCDNA